jgi:hypothetical protein
VTAGRCRKQSWLSLAAWLIQKPGNATHLAFCEVSNALNNPSFRLAVGVRSFRATIPKLCGEFASVDF